MTYVLTLISSSNSAAITDEIKDKYSTIVNASSIKWLSTNVAVDIYFDDSINDDVINQLKEEAFDYAIQKQNLI